MIRILFVFALLFAIGVGCLAFLPSPIHRAAPQQQTASLAVAPAATPAAQEARDIRVVYPAPGSSAAAVAPTTAPAAAPVAAPAPAPMSAPVATPAPATPAPQSPVPTQAADAGTSVATGTAPGAPADAPPAATGSINLNTASIDALNQIPGAGRIGKMIASHRPYHSVEDLLSKRVIRKSVYDKIKAEVAAD